MSERAAVEAELKGLLAAVTALGLNLLSAPGALAHGLAPHDGAAGGHAGPEGPLGALLLPPEYVLGGVAFFGLLYFVRRRRG